MGKFTHKVFNKKTYFAYKKALSLLMAFLFLFNLSAQALVPYQLVSSEVKEELEEALSEVYSKKTSDPAEEALKECLEKGSSTKCEEYVNIINNLFTTTRDKIENGKEGKEESYKPLSQREYTKQLQKNTAEEYKKQTEKIENKFKEESKRLENQYRGISFKSPEYSNYMLALSSLKKWQKENEENLTAWQTEVLNNTGKYYKEYTEEFEKRSKEYQAEKEKAIQEAFKELANNLMKIYNKSSAQTRKKMVDLFVMLLSMESKEVKFFDSAQRSELYRFFTRLITPGNSGSKTVNPCRFHTRARKSNELQDYEEYMRQQSAKEEARRNTLSVRDQTAKQVRPYEEMIANTLRAPITEPVEKESCQAAMSALNGLSYYKGGWWDMSSVVVFMSNNLREPMASEILLMGAKTLIETDRVDLFSTFPIALIEAEVESTQEDRLKVKEQMFFDNRFYKDPYKNSRYSKEDGGGDAFRDITEMLAKEKTSISKQVQQNILDHSIYISNGKIIFNNNLPLTYGILLNNPTIIDSFKPKASIATNSEEDLGYYYNNALVYASYFDDYMDLYIKTTSGKFYLSDKDFLTYIDGTGLAGKTAGELRKELFEAYKKNKDKKLNAYKQFIGNRKASAVFAEAFYKADFVDLTVEEKLEMDKALEKKYPTLKKLSKGHKAQLEKNRRNLDITSGVITIIDIALTVWCVSDLYKLAKWGIKGIKSLRALIVAGRTSATLSTAKRVAFFRTVIAENKEIIKVHKRIKKIKSINSRIVNKFPSYSKGIELTRISHDGQRVLTVTKLDGTPVMVGKNTVKNAPIKLETPKFEQTQNLVLSEKPSSVAATAAKKERPFTFKNMMREIKATLYLAKKNGMNLGKYFFYNLSYGKGKEIASTKNILRVEGLETGKFFNNSHYIASKHKDIFRINKDMRRAGKIGITELGEGGQVVSYIDKVKMRTFTGYTQDYLKGIEEANKSGEAVKTTKTLMEGETTLLPREFLYDKKYKSVLPFVQEKEFSKQFNYLDKVYEYFRTKDAFFFNKKTGEIFKDLIWHPDGYVSKNLLLGFDIMPSSKLAKPFNFGSRAGSTVNKTKLIEEFNTAEKALAVSQVKPLTLLNQTANLLDITNKFTFKLPKETSLFIDGNIILNKSIKNAIGEPQILSSQNIYKPGESLKEIPVRYDYVKNSSKATVIASTLNKFLEELLEYSKTHILSPQKSANYSEIISDIYHVLDDPLEIDKRFEYLLEERDLFFDKKPLVVFKGSDVDLLNPNHLKDSNIFTYDLSKIDDYKSFMAEKIRHLSSLSKEYTVYISIHGSRNAKLFVDRDRDITLMEILDIVSANKGSSTVNVISSSCHSGAALSTNLMKDGINLLLLSGANDVCTVNDMRFVQINDLRSTYLNAVKNKYYGSYLMYEDKVFNPIVDAYKYADKNNVIAKRELDLLRKIYFGDDPVGLNLFYLLSNYPKYSMPAYPFEILHNMGMIPFEFFPMDDLFNTFKAYLMPPTLDDKKWNYVLNRLDEYGYLVNVKKLPFEEVGTETYDFLINSTAQELNSSFPEWDFNEVKASIFDSAPLYPEMDDDILRVNIFPKLEHNLPLIPTVKLKENKAYIISKINKDIEKLNKIDFNSFSRKKVKAYQEISRTIREIAAKPSAFTLAQLREVEKFTYLLNMDQPYLVLQGIDLQVMLPGHIPSNNFRIVNLSKEKQYQERIAEEIRSVASVFDNFTVYIDMHGSVAGSLKVTKDKSTHLNELVDIINANRGRSKVDLISGSCHGGAGFNPYLVDSSINILLLSGSNEVCYASDKYLLDTDLPSTYLNAVEAGRFGSYLIYEGKVYNPLKQALQAAKDNESIKQELENLEKIYLEKDILGTNLAKDLLNLFTNSANYQIRNFFDKTGITQINNEKLKLLPQLPFVLNPVISSGQFALSYITGAPDYRYIFQVFDKSKKLQYKGGVEFGEPSGEIYNFILDASKNKLAGKTKIETTTPKLEASNMSLGEPNDFIFIKTPKTIAKLFKSQGIQENLADRIAVSCFEGEKQKYNPIIFEKIQEFLQAGIEPKYIDNMVAALSIKGEFSLELYDKAMLLHKKYGQTLPASAYLTNLCVKSGALEDSKFLELEKLIEDKFDFSKLSNYRPTPEQMGDFKKIKEALEILGRDVSKVLVGFAKGNGSFDIESWNNFIYLAKESKNNPNTLTPLIRDYVLYKDVIENAINILGIEETSMAMKLNEERYLAVFKDLASVFEEENLALLKEKIASLPFEEKLKTLNILSASVNRKKNILNTQGKKDLIEKISTPQAFKEEINKLIFRQLDLEYTPEIAEIFDFTSNNYINNIIDSQYHFKVNLTLLYNEISKNIGKPVKQIFDELPENLTFAEMCAQRGINYDAWRSFNPDSSITRKVLINGGATPLTRISMTVRKVDMDNISKALTAGNESASCRSVGKGECGEFSPNLIRNKMVQQVEVLVGDRPVGNALIYLAEVDGKTSIVIGSFVKRKPYHSYEVTELVLDYVRQIRSEITLQEIPIYFSNHLLFNNYYNYPLQKHDVMLIGDGYNEIFNSFTHESVMPYTHKHVEVDLFTIEEGVTKGSSREEILNSFIESNIPEKDASILTDQCFEGDKNNFNPAIFKAQKDLLSKEIDPVYVKMIIENLSPKDKFLPELYTKTMELAQTYHDNILSLSNLMTYCVENDSFSPSVYKRIQEMYDKRVNFNKLSMLKSCTVNGVFRESLFEKGLSLDKRYGSYASRVISEFTDKNGIFNEEYWTAFDNLLTETKDQFDDFYKCLKEYFYLIEPIKKSFDLLGVKKVSEAIIYNKDRYTNIFRELFESIDIANIPLLKEKLAPLNTDEQLEAITLLAGSINKKEKYLKSSEIGDLIDKIGDKKLFKEEINRIVFKQLDLEYSPEMAEIFNFASSKYLSLIMKGNYFFDTSLKSLFDTLKNNIDKPLKEIFDSLPENLAFAEICKQNNTSYEAWRSYNPDDFITRNVVMDEGKEPITREYMTVRKVDMDNILKALTSGNESLCCRSVGNGACKEAAPELIKNKMVQQIELVNKNNKVVGNVLIYLAKVNGKLSIVMGSIVRRDNYYVSKEINELVADYVRKIRQDIGRPDIPIYMSNYLKVANHYPVDWRRVTLLGEGDGKIFNSFVHNFEVPSRHKINTIQLYEVDEGIRNTNGFTNTSLNQKSATSSNTSVFTKIVDIVDKVMEDFNLPVFKLSIDSPKGEVIGTGVYLKYRNFPFILTAGHVVKDAKSPFVKVFNNQGLNIQSEVLNISANTDLAVLNVPQGSLDKFKPWTLAFKEPQNGDEMLAVGFPDGKLREKIKLHMIDTHLKGPEKQTFYLHDQGKIMEGSSGSPLVKRNYPSELLGLVVAVHMIKPIAISVPLPQIRLFLGETIKKILFTPELNQKYLPMYPDFAKKYENILTKYNLLPVQRNLIKIDNVTPNTLNTNFQPVAINANVNKALSPSEISRRLERKIPDFFRLGSGYFRGMKVNSLSEVETILKEGLPVSKTSYEGVYFAPDLELAFAYADNHEVEAWIPVLLKDVNYKVLTPVDPFKTEYVSQKDVLPGEIGDVIVWTTVDGKEGWYKAILDKDNKLALIHVDEVHAQINSQIALPENTITSWLSKLKSKVVNKNSKKKAESYLKKTKIAEAYLKEAKAAYEIEDLDLAEDFYKQAIAEDPNNAKYYYEIGKFYDDVYIDDHYKKLALENYNKAISLDPRKGKYYYSRALLKKYFLKDIPGAINDLAMSMEYGLKGFYTENLFREWSGQSYKDYIKNLESFPGTELKLNFKPVSLVKPRNFNVFNSKPYNPTRWTQEEAENYLMKQGFSRYDVRQVIEHCQYNKEFRPEIFDLFAKGYEIKPDKNFAMVALYYSLKGESFDYQRYSTIYAIAKRNPKMTFSEIQHYCEATPEQLEALFYAADNFPQINPFKVMDLASSSYGFKADTFNLDNYKRIISLLKEGISFDAAKSIYETCVLKDYNKYHELMNNWIREEVPYEMIDKLYENLSSQNNSFDEITYKKIENIANAAIARKDIFFSVQNHTFNFNDILVKNFIYKLSSEIKETLEIVDEPTLIAAMGYKMVRFENFVKTAKKMALNLSGKSIEEFLIRERFLTIFYPAKTEKAKELEMKIAELKSRFSNTPKSELPDLKNQINTYIKQFRTLLDQGKMLSPQDKIKMIEFMGQFINSQQDLEELFETIQKIKTEGKDAWNKKVFELVVSRLGSTYNEKVEEKLHLLQSPHLMDIFKSLGNMGFKQQFKKLLDLLSKDDFGKTLDALPHNIVTQQEFKKYALDYKKYTNPKVFPSKTFYDGDNLVEIRQVNMRDVSKSLYLGNESSACTAIGSCSLHDSYAIPYITNTFVSAIEVLVNGKPVGNTMIYPVLVDKANNQGQELALLIDDLKINNPYNKPEYLKEVSLLAENIAKNIGIKEGKVYISDSNTLGYDKRYRGLNLDFHLIGKTGDGIFLNATLGNSILGEHSAILVPSEKIK